MSLRNSDTKSEIAVAKFLDTHFYPKYTFNNERVSDFETQMKGVDVVFDIGDLKAIRVDEKAAVHYVNKDLRTFAFEINFFRTSNILTEGWFYDKSKVTEYYLLCWIWAKKEKYFNADDITKLDIILISRTKIISMLSEFGVNYETAKTTAENLRKNGISGPHEKVSNKPFYYFYTDKLSEKPINIVIQKFKLIELSTCYKTIVVQ